MPKATKQQPVKKRAYKKKATKSLNSKVSYSNKDSSEWVPELVTAKKDTEVESLAAICSIFDNWNNDQKQRNLKYLCGRYYDFL